MAGRAPKPVCIRLINFEALALLGELTLILDNAAKSGFERIDSDGDRVFDFAYWASECRRIASL